MKKVLLFVLFFLLAHSTIQAQEISSSFIIESSQDTVYGNIETGGDLNDGNGVFLRILFRYSNQ